MPRQETVTDADERVILSARAELASRACDSARLALCLETLFLKDALLTPEQANMALDGHTVALGLRAS